MDAFVMLADCEVIYNGRANSTLERGKYLITYKQDGSLFIHGSTLTKACNYIGPGNIATIGKFAFGYTYIFKLRNETIIIKIYNTFMKYKITDWSDHKITVTKTERELVGKLLNTWDSYFGSGFTISNEYQTDVGNIDLIGFRDNDIIIVELKRKTAIIKDYSQLHRYVCHFTEKYPNVLVKGYIASPKIGKNCLKKLQDNYYGWIRIDFDDELDKDK